MCLTLRCWIECNFGHRAHGCNEACLCASLNGCLCVFFILVMNRQVATSRFSLSLSKGFEQKNIASVEFSNFIVMNLAMRFLSLFGLCAKIRYHVSSRPRPQKAPSSFFFFELFGVIGDFLRVWCARRFIMFFHHSMSLNVLINLIRP